MKKKRAMTRAKPADQAALDERFMRQALDLARRGVGRTSPNPMVGAVLVKNGRVLGKGWHRQAGGAHAELEALGEARRKGRRPQGGTLYVTLEPCSTQGRTPPCTGAIIEAGIGRVVAGAVDPNPAHAGRGFDRLREAGLEVRQGVLEEEAAGLNRAFNHWIVHRRPWVTVKAAMTLDGKIATAQGESKWITGPKARAKAMELRREADALIVGVETVLADDPQLTVRLEREAASEVAPRRLVLDSRCRIPLDCRLVSDEFVDRTTVVTTRSAPQEKVAALKKKVRVLMAPARRGRVDVKWLLQWLGGQEVTSVLVEGGGEVAASIFFQGCANRVAFFYAPKILGGYRARMAVAGVGAGAMDQAVRLGGVSWHHLGGDLLLMAEVRSQPRIVRRTVAVERRVRDGGRGRGKRLIKKTKAAV